MTARKLDVNTYLLSDDEGELTLNSVESEQASTSITYNLDDITSIQTLSGNLDGEQANQVRGLLYVPSLLVSDSCHNQTLQYAPQNVTRRNDLPLAGQTVVALIPWFSITCTKSYLGAAMQDEQDTTAVLFYQVNDTSTGTPPTVNNVVWNLDDGGRWKSQINFPAYAVPGPTGRQLMHELSLYSGVLLAVVTSSSILMGLLQRRRREALRRRVENGQVDLEALGIKRINVPQTELDKLPLYIYKDGVGSIAEESTTSVDEPTTSKDTKAVPSKVSKSSEPSPISPKSNLSEEYIREDQQEVEGGDRILIQTEEKELMHLHLSLEFPLSHP
ncbi:putative ring finger domain-containing protein [Phaeomoniella chlamydospora]|uniref:Putative ring finger domain-containing protein n=1 Tax=Phaeomoniella chlamydospora TaxID=158046 RepID=A0A0G2EK97_PHACM|nr:putative ring finger domain-containing protein [Phaeomoniella chlamydospora]